MLLQVGHQFLVAINYSLLDSLLIGVGPDHVFGESLFEVDDAGATDGGGGRELQVGTVYQELYAAGNVEDFAGRQAEASAVVQDTVEVLDPVCEDDSLQVDQQLMIGAAQNVLPDLFGEVAVLENASSCVRLPVYFLYRQGIYVDVLHLVVVELLFKHSHRRGFPRKNIPQKNNPDSYL